MATNFVSNYGGINMAENNPFNSMRQDLQDNEQAEQQAIPRRSARRRRHAEEAQQQVTTPQQQEQPAMQTASQPTPEPVQKQVSPEEQRLEEIFGPVDNDMTKIQNVVLTDIYPAEDDETDGQKWLILDFEYQPTDSVFGLNMNNSNFKVEPQQGSISLNTQVAKDPNAAREDRVYIDDADRKALIDATIDYAFGKKYDVHNFEEMSQKFNAILDDPQAQDITFDVYQNVFPVEAHGKRVYRTAYRLINRHQTNSFIETEFVGQPLFKESAIDNNRIPVKIIQVNDNLNIYKKKDENGNEKVYPFARLEVYVEYCGTNPEFHGKKYLIKYNYLNQRDSDGHAIPQAQQTPDFDKRLRKYHEVADKLGLQGDNKSLISQIEALKDVKAFAIVEKSTLNYTGGEHKGEPIYYMKLTK